MTTNLITLCYRKVISGKSATHWEKMVWADSYQEFKMQFQLYNQQKRYHRLQQLLDEVKGAEQLHFLVSAAIVGYVQQLKERVPDITDTLGIPFLQFDHFRFELIESDIHDQQQHKIAIWFFCKPMLWIDSIGNHMLLKDNNSEQAAVSPIRLLEMQPGLGVHSLQPYQS